MHGDLLKTIKKRSELKTNLHVFRPNNGRDFSFRNARIDIKELRPMQNIGPVLSVYKPRSL